MNGEIRRSEILQKLQNSGRAISGSALAKTFGVSRQVIVQDIAKGQRFFKGLQGCVFIHAFVDEEDAELALRGGASFLDRDLAQHGIAALGQDALDGRHALRDAHLRLHIGLCSANAGERR